MKLFIYISILILVFTCQDKNKQVAESVSVNSDTTRPSIDSALSNPKLDIRVQVNSDSAQIKREREHIFYENNRYLPYRSTIIVTRAECSTAYWEGIDAGERLSDDEKEKIKAMEEEYQREADSIGTQCLFEFYINCFDSITLLYLDFPAFGSSYKFKTNDGTQVWLSHRDTVQLFIGSNENHAIIINKKIQLHLIRNDMTDNRVDFFSFDYSFHFEVHGNVRVENYKLGSWAG